MAERRGSIVDWIVFVLLATMWGSSFMFIKIALEQGMGPLSVVTYRLLIGGAVLVVLLRLTRSRLPGDRRALATMALVGVINIVIPFTLIHWSEQYIDSALASILNGLVPLFAIGIAAVMLPDEPITTNRLVGLVVGFAGAAILLSRDLGAGPGADATMGFLGQLAVVVASGSYALSAVVMRKVFSGRKLIDDPITGPRSPNPVESALPQVVLGLSIEIALAASLEWTHPGAAVLPPTPTAWFAVGWLGLFGSALAYVAYFRLLSAWGATRSTLVTYAMPVVGLILGVLVLGERVDLRVLAGLVLIIAGIALVSSPIGQRRLYGRGEATATLPRD
jgi:drug/metabolite transporter (DMT)-like permease